MTKQMTPTPVSLMEAQEYIFEKKLLASTFLLNELAIDCTPSSYITDALAFTMKGYLIQRELERQKFEIPLNLCEHIKLVAYQKYPRLTSQLSRRFPVLWRNISPQIIQALDVPEFPGLRTKLYVMEPFKF